MKRILFVGALALLSCGEDGDGMTEAAAPDGGAPAPVLPPEMLTFYDELRATSERFVFTDGEWREDYGDAPFYGTAFHVRVGLAEGQERDLDLAMAARDRNLTVLRRANDDFDWFLANLEEVLMSALGLIEHVGLVPDPEARALIDEFVDATNSLMRVFGRYLPADLEAGRFALGTYGPTAITGAVALLNLQYATYLRDADGRVEEARRLVAAIDENAWGGAVYRFAPDEERLFLYPNSIMLMVLVRLYEQTGEDAYLERARTLVDGIEPLRSPSRGGFHSPYSAEAMGAETDDYSTLSSQNYLSLGLILLYGATREVRYFEEAVGVLEFSRTRMYEAGPGRLVHHFMDGRMAIPEDPEYWCSGCNLQWLYAVWYLRNVVLAGDT